MPLGWTNMKINGIARVFNTTEDCCAAIKQKKIKSGDCVVLRYIGPKGAPGMKEATLPAAMLYGAGLHQTVALMTDGRINEGYRGLSVGHVTPEAVDGDTFALIEDDDKIEIDLQKGKINVFIASKDLSLRRKKWKPRDLAARHYLLRYTAFVGDANTGAAMKTKFK
jgi:dihydroxy-acid dehydratase